MDIQEYISSGILESYALGLCSEVENQEVERLADQYAEIRLEIGAIRASLEKYAALHAKNPSPQLREKVLAAVEELAGKEIQDSKTVRLQSSALARGGWYLFAMAATYGLLLASIGINIYLYSNLNSANQKLATINAEKIRVSQELQVTQTSNLAMNEELSVLKAPGNKPVVLKGMPMSPDSKAMVYWNPEKADVFISVSSLPAIEGDKQYQLWALVDGKPVDAGVFDMTPGAMQKMKAIPNAQAFAVTLEKKGGSPTPTIEAMYLMGYV